MLAAILCADSALLGLQHRRALVRYDDQAVSCVLFAGRLVGAKWCEVHVSQPALPNHC